jgi:hypothetical protein
MKNRTVSEGNVGLKTIEGDEKPMIYRAQSRIRLVMMGGHI